MLSHNYIRVKLQTDGHGDSITNLAQGGRVGENYNYKLSYIGKALGYSKPEGFKNASLVQKLRRCCRTGKIGCTVKKLISFMANQLTVHSCGVSWGGSAIKGA